jgi:AcrR family transcriptional regulator
MKKTSSARERTRRAILEAVADVITDTNGIGFSMQAVADRAGVTHRTVYNHFPTREALCEAFAEYTDSLFSESGGEPLDTRLSLDRFPAMTSDLYRVLGAYDRYVRAYVTLMIGNRQPLKSWQGRSRRFEKQIARAAAWRAPIEPRQVAAAVRLFVSSIGWHILTEQCGLSNEEAAATGAWATGALIEAATGRHASAPSLSPPQKGAHDATRHRRT